MINDTLSLDLLDDDAAVALAELAEADGSEFATDDDAAFAAPDTHVGRSFIPTETPAPVAVAEAPAKPKRAPKAKAPKVAAEVTEAPAKAKRAPKAPKVVAEAPAVVEDAEVTNKGKFVGLNMFDRIRSTGATSAEAMWAKLLTDGSVTVSLTAEVNVISKSTLYADVMAASIAKGSDAKLAAKEARAAVDKAAANRVTQRLTQSYQRWYANEGKATGVFGNERDGQKLTITYMDNTRPPVLVSESGRPTMVGKVALKLLKNGGKFGKCGVTLSGVRALAKAQETPKSA
jgi:hypothetical protein